MRRRFLHLILLFSVLVAFVLGCGSGGHKSSMTGPGAGSPGMSGSPSPSPTATPVLGSPMPTPTPTPQSGEVRLQARGEAVINGVEAELRGEFERELDRTRLEGKLENINLPIGSAISFCLQHGKTTIPLAVGIIQSQDEEREAEFRLRTDEGQNPPNVQVGDVLQARDGANGSMADCMRSLLVAGTFVPDND